MKKRKKFQILGKRTYLEKLGVAKVKSFSPDENKIYITLPKPIGNAVRRNRFKRLARSVLPSLDSTLLEKNSLWISLDRKFRLSRKITRSDWQEIFKKIIHAAQD
jgi:ribonuclease P protein component